MTTSKKSTEPKQNEELDLRKKTLKDLPESGNDVMGGKKNTVGVPESTAICLPTAR